MRGVSERVSRASASVRQEGLAGLVEHRREVFCALVWGGMTAVAALCVAWYGRDVPLAEDWLLVAPYTGNEPDLLGWLWAQNNEHRVPLPRLIYLALLGLSGGDFRSGMVYNVVVLAALSAALTAAARRLRGGRSAYADAAFPVLLLHLGHWPNLVWGWQLQFVTAVALTVGLFLVLLRPRPLAPRSALGAGLGLVLLPLCGANGIIYALALAPWLGYEGVALGRSRAAPSARRRAGWALAALAAAAVALSGLYFVGYQRATWNPPPPGGWAVLTTSARFVAMGFGPGVQEQWVAAILGTAAFLIPTGIVLVRAALRLRGPEQRRALGLLCFAGASAGLALAVGWGRSGLMPEVGMPARYALLSAPTLIAGYFVWVLYGSRRLGGGVALAFFAGVLLLGPFNTRVGLGWRNWYLAGMDAFERDLRDGVPIEALAERHQAFLLHWDLEKLEAGLRALRQGGLGLFTDRTPPADE